MSNIRSYIHELLNKNWSKLKLSFFFPCHQHIFLIFHLNVFSIIGALNDIGQNLDKDHTGCHSVQSWHFGVFPFYLISFQFFMHIYTCFSMLPIKTIFTSSNHSTGSELSSTVKCTRAASGLSVTISCTQAFPCRLTCFLWCPDKLPGYILCSSIDL